METQALNKEVFLLVMLGMAGTLLLAGSVIFFYIRYQRRFLHQRDALQKKELDHKKHLLYTSIQSQEEERMRISRDLHDHVGSRLSNLRMLLGRMQKLPADASSVQTITETSKQGIDEVIADIRSISHALLPPGLSLWGFQHSLEDLCEKTKTSSGLDVQLIDQTSGALQNIPFDTALSLYRVIQEALANTLKHAGAKSVTITLCIKEGMGAIDYTDDGKGADMTVKAKGLGLYNMESRLSMINAAYQLTTAIGQGFKLSIYNIPLQ
jgi:signal transduction histidine kinase